MNQIPRLIGHLQWLLSRPGNEIRERALELHNCATRIRLSTFDPEAWAREDSDRTRIRLRALVDSLTNVALRIYLDNRDQKAGNVRLMETLLAKGQAVTKLLQKAGFRITAKQDPASSTPPSLTEIYGVVSRLPGHCDAFPPLPKAYVGEIAGGILDVLAGVAHTTGPETDSGVARTMKNMGAAAIKLAQKQHDKAAIPPALRQHDRLAAEILRRK